MAGEQKWTPGPWFVTDETSENDHWYAGRTIGSTPEGSRICDLTPLRTKEGNEANARLIAAAPEMAEALAEAAGWFEEYANQHYAKALHAPDGGEQHSREVKGKTNADRAQRLRAALAKARGE